MRRIAFVVVIAAVAGFVAAGCGPTRFAPGGDASIDSTPTVELIPTYTPTMELQSTALTATDAPPSENTPAPSDVQPAGGEDVPTTEATTAEPSDGDAALLPTATPAPTEAEPAQAPASGSPVLRVASASVNVRRGPGTEYDPIGVVVEGETFTLNGRNEQGDWWQVCCFGDEQGWLYAPLVEVQNADEVALSADIPPTPESAPTTESVPIPLPVVEEEAAPEPVAQEQPPEPASPEIAANAGTAGSFDPEAQYQIVHYRMLGFDDNNGGIFNKGGQQIIFVTVLDENGNGVNDAVIKDAVGDKLHVPVGSKGPGKAEIKMDWDPYKLYVASDPSGAVTSQVSNQMNNPYPHIPDVVGMLGPADNEYAICPTVEDRCDPPFYHAHWSYEITFQKVR